MIYSWRFKYTREHPTQNGDYIDDEKTIRAPTAQDALVIFKHHAVMDLVTQINSLELVETAPSGGKEAYREELFRRLQALAERVGLPTDRFLDLLEKNCV